MSICSVVVPCIWGLVRGENVQGCIQKFCRGGANLGYGQKRGGAPGGSSIVSCKVLHSRGGENDTRGGRMPLPPPLNTALMSICSEWSHAYGF